MGDWQAIRLGDFAPFKYGKALPERHRRPGNVPVYGSNGVVGSHDTPLIDRPMVVIGRKGSIGEVHFSPQGGWPIDTTFYVTADQGYDIRFTYYLLRTLGMQHMSSDSAVPGLNREAAHNLVVEIPPSPSSVRSPRSSGHWTTRSKRIGGSPYSVRNWL